MTARRAAPVLLPCLLGLAACNLAPHYDPPRTATQPAFKEAVPDGHEDQGWKPADPKDEEIPSHWWEIYRDPELDALESRVAISNQTVAAAEANYRSAEALVRQAQAAFFPTFSLNPSVTRSRSSAGVAQFGGGTAVTTGTGGTTGTVGTGGTNSTVPHTTITLPVDASYQIDLWGSVRDAVAGKRYTAAAGAAQVVTALLSTQSQLAQDYFQLRAVDEQRRILDATLTDYESSIHLVGTLIENGVDSNEDLSEAENQLATAEAQATDLGIARAQYEHAIAVLIGVPPGNFSLAVRPFKPTLPAVPVGLPSTLLERRADIAAAERQVAAANAAIGVARAAYFPTLTLTASGGYESTAVRQLLDWPNRFWSFGPGIAATLFDGGAHRAAVAQARAATEQAAANYRQTVLMAFQSVEDNLASLRILSKELTQRHEATVAAQRTVELSVVRYRNGVDSYVNVITAQNTFLSSREAELQVQLDRQIASINLVNDLGGGWNTAGWSEIERMSAQPAATPAAAPAGDPVLPNPPPLPIRDIHPEQLLQQNEDAMAH